MMAVLRKAGMEWEPKYGPAFILGVAQLLIWIGAAVGGYYVIAENTKMNTEATAKLERLVDRQQTVLEIIGNRVTKVESATENINHSLDRIEHSVQRLAFPQRNP